MAVGKAGQPADRDRLAIWIGDEQVTANGVVLADYSEERATEHLRRARSPVTGRRRRRRRLGHDLDLRPDPWLHRDQRRVPVMSDEVTNGQQGPRGYSPEQRTAALVEALPYIQRFRGAIVVVKFGGNAMVDDRARRARSPKTSSSCDRSGCKPVVVHGGGPQIGELLGRLGKVTEFRDGLRVTDAETLDVARMVLVGKVDRDIVGEINMHGAYAVGMSGEDGGLIQAVAPRSRAGFRRRRRRASIPASSSDCWPRT